MSQLDNRTSAPAAAPEVVCDSGRTVVDVRGPRFGAAITTVVLGLILLTIPSPVSVALLVWQTLVFGLGAIVGLQAQPYGVLFRRVVRPRIGEATEFEDAAPPRFAQTVGLVALLLGVTVVAYVAVAFAFAAAFLNAAFAFCLGCEVYLLGKRVLSRA